MAEAGPDKRVRWFVTDEARVGQQGTLTRMWARTGSRPTAVRQAEYEWVYSWAAAGSATGASIAMITPTVNTGLMNTFMTGPSGMLAVDEHAVLVLDDAGRHTAKTLMVPGNVPLSFLPPYTPESNPAERLWAWLRSHRLYNRVYADYDELLRQANRAWLTLGSGRIKKHLSLPLDRQCVVLCDAHVESIRVKPRSHTVSATTADTETKLHLGRSPRCRSTQHRATAIRPNRNE